PLVVGDRLDTDIEGAVGAGVDSLLVLTGVTDGRRLLAAPPHHRPTYVDADLRGLLTGQPAVTDADGGG
ncbi:HAD hydrolase-like protein, partial [Streptomyces sp. TRM76130]|nr:HAD hydrolase-like protein [Streptomyces sp. TRM76130]